MDQEYLDAQAKSLEKILKHFEEATGTKVIFNACCCGNLVVAESEDLYGRYSALEGYGASD